MGAKVMPRETLLVIAAITIPVVILALVLASSGHRTQKSRRTHPETPPRSTARQPDRAGVALL
jgi:hypothetical protein